MFLKPASDSTRERRGAVLLHRFNKKFHCCAEDIKVSISEIGLSRLCGGVIQLGDSMVPEWMHFAGWRLIARDQALTRRTHAQSWGQKREMKTWWEVAVCATFMRMCTEAEVNAQKVVSILRAVKTTNYRKDGTNPGLSPAF